MVIHVKGKNLYIYSYFVLLCASSTKYDTKTFIISHKSLPNIILSSSLVLSYLFCLYFFFYPKIITKCYIVSYLVA